MMTSFDLEDCLFLRQRGNIYFGRLTSILQRTELRTLRTEDGKVETVRVHPLVPRWPEEYVDGQVIIYHLLLELLLRKVTISR